MMENKAHTSGKQITTERIKSHQENNHPWETEKELQEMDFNNPSILN